MFVTQLDEISLILRFYMLVGKNRRLKLSSELTMQQWYWHTVHTHTHIYVHMHTYMPTCAHICT